MKMKQKFRKAISFLLSTIMIVMLCFESGFGTITVHAIDYFIGESDGFSLDSEKNLSATFTIDEALGTGEMRGWLLCLFTEKPSVNTSTGKLDNSGSMHPYYECSYYFFSPDTEKVAGTRTASWNGVATDEKGSGKTLAQVIKEENWHIVIGPRYYYTGWGASGIGKGNNGIWENCDYYVGQASEKINGYNNSQNIVPMITMDRTNYVDGNVSLITYDSEGSYVAEVGNNNATLTLPQNGYARVVADGEFTVTADGATISEMLVNSEGYSYKITNITADTTVMVYKTVPIKTLVYNGVTYYPLGQNTSLTEGNYYLPADVIINGSITISGTVNLCLNGNVLNADSIKVSNGATLNVVDGRTTEHKYQSSDTSYWTPDESGDQVIVGGILCSPIINEGTFHLKEGTICGVNGVVINNKATATIGTKGAVIGNYNGTSGYDEEDIPTTIPAIVYNGKGATISNSGKINNNVSVVHTVCNDGGIFTNEKTGTINENRAISKSDGTDAGGVANYTRNISYISKFHNYGQINNNTSARSSGGVLNKAGEFTNYATGQINGNVAARHCGGVDNTSNAFVGEYTGAFFKNYGQVNGNKVLATNGGGNGAGIYNEANATIYNYGEVCGNTAVGQGGGIFFNDDGSGTLIVGGRSKVTGNKDAEEINSNICVGSGKVIQFDSEYSLIGGATMGIYLYNNGRIDGIVSSGYTTQYNNIKTTTYFFADTSTQRVKLENGEVYLETHTHELNLVPGASATCTTAGNKAYYKCIVGDCDYLFADKAGNTFTTLQDVTIGAYGHNMSGATCTEPSKCQRNGCTYTEGSVLGHNMSEATCTEISKCQRNGCTYTEGSALGHDMSVATCTEASKCQRNGCTYTEGSALGHDMSVATCTEASKCQRNGCTYTEGSALGHDMSEATCTEASKCQRNGCTYTEGSVLEHKTGELKKDADCHWKECSCGYKEVEQHKCVWYIETEATDTVQGKMRGVCDVCGHETKKETPVTDEIAGSGEVQVISPETNANKAKIQNAEKTQKYIPLTDEERAEIVNGEDLDIILEVTDITETVKQEDKAKIETEMDNYKLGMYMDVSLWKKIGTRNKEYVSKTSDKISIMFMMPESLKAGTGKERIYKVMRLHDGVVTIIDTNMNTTTGEITFETDSFSVYALVFDEFVKATEVPSVTPTVVPSVTPVVVPTTLPGVIATIAPSVTPTETPTVVPSITPTETPVVMPTVVPVVTSTPAITKTVKPILLSQVMKKTKNAIKVSWNKIEGVTGYEIYVTTCGNNEYKLAKTVKSNKKLNATLTKINGKKIADVSYKFKVKAYKLVDGKKEYVAQSKVIHLVKSTKKCGNAEAVLVKKTKITLKAGKTAKISASVKMPKGLKQSSVHGAEIRYISSDKKVAKVSANGTILATGKGKCKIYVLAINGKYKAISVTVK